MCLTKVLSEFLSVSLSEFLCEDILGAAQFFGSLQILLSSLPLSTGGFGITRASNIFHYVFLSSALITQKCKQGYWHPLHCPPLMPQVSLPSRPHRYLSTLLTQSSLLAMALW